MPSTLVAVAAQAARSSAENARDSPEGLRPTAKIVAVCVKVDGIGLTPVALTLISIATIVLIAPRSVHFDRGAINDYGQKHRIENETVIF